MLKDASGFLLFRTKTGGQHHPLTQLQCSLYNIPDITQEVIGAACIYISFLQTQVSLAKGSQKVCLQSLIFIYAFNGIPTIAVMMA